MQTIRVNTTQNVYIHYPLASVGDRLLAYLIDQVILILYSIAMIALLIKLETTTWWVWLLCVGFPYFFYSLVCEILMNGQSPGKYAMKIKIVRLNGTPPGPGDFVIRWMFRLVDFFIASGAVAMIAISAGNKGQRIGDMVAGTSVVKLAEQKEFTANDVFVVPTEDYTPVFQQVANLSSKDIELIQQALEVNRLHGNNLPARIAAEKIKAVLGIETDMPEIKFLYTIVKDFNYLTALPA